LTSGVRTGSGRHPPVPGATGGWTSGLLWLADGAQLEGKASRYLLESATCRILGYGGFARIYTRGVDLRTSPIRITNWVLQKHYAYGNKRGVDQGHYGYYRPDGRKRGRQLNNRWSRVVCRIMSSKDCKLFLKFCPL
jgi:hypothetical protein